MTELELKGMNDYLWILSMCKLRRITYKLNKVLHRNSDKAAGNQKEKWGLNKDKSNATNKTTDAHRKNNYNNEIALEWSEIKLLWGKGSGEGVLKPVILWLQSAFAACNCIYIT